MDKILKLLEIAKKFGVKPSKVIGTQGNVVPYKKPSLVEVNVDEFKLKESIDSGAMTMDKVQQEIEETVRLALSKNLNDVELNRALNNAVNIERQFFPPVADVIAAGSGKQVTGKGLEELIDKEGLISPPSTPIGKIQFSNKRAEYEMNKIIKESDLDSLLKGINKDRLAEMRLHNEGLVRAVTRQILSEDIKAGKIKSLTLDDLGTSREPIDYFRKIYGENALEQLDSLIPDFNRLNTEQEAANLARSKFKFEPDEFRLKGSTSYEDVEKAKTTEKEKGFFERLFGSKKQEKEPAEVLDITAEGNKRKSVDELIDEYNANQDRTRLLDERGENAISYEEFQDIQKKNEDIAKELEKKGVKSTPEPEEVKEEGIVIPFRKKFPKPEPEGKAQGGIIGYAMGGRIGFASGSDEDGILGKIKKDYDKSITKKIIDWNTDITEKTYDYLDKLGAPKPFQNAIESKKFEDEINLSKRILEMKKFKEANKKEKRTEEAEGGRIGFASGKSKTILDLIAKANKKLKDKKSMESVNPKTGEVTVPKEPIKTAEEPTGMTTMDPEPEIIDEKSITKNKSIMTIDDLQFKHKDAFNAHDQISVDIGDKIAPDMIAESMAEMKGKDYFNLSQKEQSNLYKKALAYVDDVRMTKKQNKSLYVRGDAITEENFGNTPFAPDLSGLEEARKMTKGMNLQEEMDMVLNQYDKSMFIKNEQGKVDVTNSQNVERMALLLKKDHPELYNRIFNLTDDLNQKEILSDFDVTGRKPNAKGGPAGGLDYLMGF
jgi:hypothetical protein